MWFEVGAEEVVAQEERINVKNSKRHDNFQCDAVVLK